MVSKGDDDKRIGVVLPAHKGEPQCDSGFPIEGSPSIERKTHLRLSHALTDTGAKEFQHLAVAERDRLLGAVTQSYVDFDAGRASASNQKQVGCFDRWRRFLGDHGIEDEWLSQFKGEQRSLILSAFASACRRNQYGTTRKYRLKGGTVKSTVTHVRSAFRENLRPDPGLDVDGKFSVFLTRQIAGYVDADPSTKQEKALPLSVFRVLL